VEEAGRDDGSVMIPGGIAAMESRIFRIGVASLECTLHGAGETVVLLPNAGCSASYFQYFARQLALAGFQTAAINMRCVANSSGPLAGVSLHDLAADVAGVIEALGCARVHVLGHAFGNRVARCLAADRPDLVRSVILLAAGGLIAPPTPLGSAFRNAGEAMRSGPECAALGARWLSPASDASILEPVECSPMMHIAQLATSQNTRFEDWWSAATAPMLIVQGLDDDAAPPGNGYALRDALGDRVQVVDIPRAGHFMILEQPDAVLEAVLKFLSTALR
jgi:pimeloyl-ACP methyl ester carboxylesterase